MGEMSVSTTESTWLIVLIVIGLLVGFVFFSTSAPLKELTFSLLCNTFYDVNYFFFGPRPPIELCGPSSGANVSSTSHKGGENIVMVAGKDSDNDGLWDFVEEQLGTNPNKKDTDDDSLLDLWEVKGYDADNDGTIDVELPKMGADPLKKDIFLEIDWMEDSEHTHKPNRNKLGLMVNSFRKHNINLHIDTGDATSLGLTRGNSIPEKIISSEASGNREEEIFKIKQVNFDPKRKKIFRYGLIIEHNEDDIGGHAYYGGGTFFINDELDIGNHDSKIIVSIMHELGHLLNLGHGGSLLTQSKALTSPGGDSTWDLENFKPNYLSIMNYYFQMAGGVPAFYQNSPILRLDYSDGALPQIDENNLDERIGLGIVDKSLKGVTFYSCMGKGDEQNDLITISLGEGESVSIKRILIGETPLGSGGSVDWNCDGDISESIFANINGDGINRWEKVKEGARSVLYGRNDWNSLKFSIPDYDEKGVSGLHDDLPLREIKIIYEICNGFDDNGNGKIDESCPDKDKDGVPDDIDNCPDILNADQKDSDKNLIGDACDVKVDYEKKMRDAEEKLKEGEPTGNLIKALVILLALATIVLAYKRLRKKKVHSFSIFSSIPE